MAFLGLVLIAYGYYASTKLFDINNAGNLFNNMIIILATTIGGTFLVFRFSVAFIMNTVRLKKNGHLTVHDVLALTPIMHRMKSNAKSLTLITVLTGVSLELPLYHIFRIIVQKLMPIVKSLAITFCMKIKDRIF
ncbi:hypothetical protein LSPH24S_09038 [Lysinibacillus sphaericus]